MTGNRYIPSQDESIAAAQAAVASSPHDPRLHNELGILQGKRQHWPESIASFTIALRLAPEFADAHHNLSVALWHAGDLPQALSAAEQATILQPSLATYQHLAQIQSALGMHQASHITRETIYRLFPHDRSALADWAISLQRTGHYDDALNRFEQLVVDHPTMASAWSQRGLLLMQMGRLEDALASTSKAISMAEATASAWNSHGLLLVQSGDPMQGLECFERAVQLSPNDSDAHVNRSMVWLMLGDFERGWAEYEWRRNSPRGPQRRGDQPQWTGEPLSGRQILLHDEQGLGDTLQFVRYIPLVQEAGGKVILECHPRLAPLLQQSGNLGRVIPRGEPGPEVAVHAPLLSLPHLFQTRLETVPNRVPYLFADRERVARWKKVLPNQAGLQVGIAWQGSPTYPADKYRSVPLRHFLPLFSLPGIAWICLQAQDGLAQRDLLPQRPPWLDLSSQLDQDGAFLDTAAILSQIDLLITTDSALAHLAGGLGVPTWVILGKVPDWRWQLHGTTSPWYPTLRLYRQQHLRDWASVIAQIATDLRTWCDTTPIPAHAASDADSSRTAPASPELLIPVGPGELFDKITILELKARRIQSEEKRRVVQVELSRLNAIRDEVFPDLAPKVILSIRALHEVNGRLWDVEDALRRHEMQQDFGASFIHYARSVYELNDRRAALKNEINALLGSTLVEVKDYPNLASK